MADFATLQSSIGVTFNDATLLEQALVHRSYPNETSAELSSNERLEFLGDALIGLAVADDSYQRFPDLQEGDLTKLRAAVVCKDSLAQVARSLDLGENLYLGRGEEQGGGRKRDRNLACAFEALIGAVLLDRGYDIAKDLVLKLIRPLIEQSAEQLGVADYKSKLQELIQLKQQVTPTYRVVKAVGPDHDRDYYVEVAAAGVVIGMGSGKSKQQAEKDAARVALEKLNGENCSV
ncbi:ribonuclease III [Chloroflexota bacterium]